MRQYLRRWLPLCVLLLGVITAYIIQDWLTFKRTPLLQPTAMAVDYVLQPGTSIRGLAADLEQLGLLKKPGYFLILAQWHQASRQLKAGEYRFLPGITPNQLLDQLVQGKVLKHQITFVEGWRFDRILAQLRQQSRLSHQITQLPPETIMAKLGQPNVNPEGWFFPDTYTFTAGTSDLAILQQAYNAMVKYLETEWQQRAEGLPYQSSYEALIVASLIEKETRLAHERPIIAQVIVNRLQKNMLLQIDPTVIYGLGQLYVGKLRTVDLYLDTPYNTYRHKGLPPTPIAMPSAASIHAALHPEPSEALYFVAKGDGGHRFSATLKEHEQAVQNYLQVKRSLAKMDSQIAQVLDCRPEAMTVLLPCQQEPIKSQVTKNQNLMAKFTLH